MFHFFSAHPALWLSSRSGASQLLVGECGHACDCRAHRIIQGSARERAGRGKDRLEEVERMGGKQRLKGLGMRQGRAKEYRGARKRRSSQECRGCGGGSLQVIKA